MIFNIINIINFIRFLTKDDYDRFIRFLNECCDCPYFSTLYDIDDFNKDVEYFKAILELYKGGENNDTK